MTGIRGEFRSFAAETGRCLRKVAGGRFRCIRMEQIPDGTESGMAGFRSKIRSFAATAGRGFRKIAGSRFRGGHAGEGHVADTADPVGSRIYKRFGLLFRNGGLFGALADIQGLLSRSGTVVPLLPGRTPVGSITSLLGFGTVLASPDLNLFLDYRP